MSCFPTPAHLASWAGVCPGNTDYRDLGGDYFLRRDPDRERRRAITALNKLGYALTINPTEPAEASA
jgi:hypothetical protein